MTQLQRTVRFVEAVLAALNLPSNKGARLLAPARAARAAIRLLHQHAVDIVALQELATVSEAVFRLDPRWKVSGARFNNVFASGRRIRNALAFRARDWRRRGRRRNLRQAMPGRPRGLNLPAQLFEHRDTGAQLAVIGVHSPRRKLDPETNAAVVDLVLDYATALSALGISVAIAGDFNRADLRAAFRAAGFRIVSRHGVDWIVIDNAHPLDGHAIEDGVLGEISDHPLILGRIRIPAPRAALRRLPSLARVRQQHTRT